MDPDPALVIPFGPPAPLIDVSDRPFVWIPEHSLTASVGYELPLPTEFGSVRLQARAYHQSEVFIQDGVEVYNLPGIDNGPLNDSLREAAYTIIDYRLTWTGIFQSGFDAAVWVNNATDREYATGGLNVLDSLGWAANVYGPPRTIGASLRYSF